MRLRQILNENRLARAINESSVGRAFHKSDFAYSVERLLEEYGKAVCKGNMFEKGYLIAVSPFIFSVITPFAYALTKI